MQEERGSKEQVGMASPGRGSRLPKADADSGKIEQVSKDVARAIIKDDIKKNVYPSECGKGKPHRHIPNLSADHPPELFQRQRFDLEGTNFQWRCRCGKEQLLQCNYCGLCVAKSNISARALFLNSLPGQSP